MKQLLSLALALLPCLAWAQYPSNGNQKITLGEQTTADGLVWRGRLADTANLLTNKLDTSVYIVLDTGTQAMWYYRASTTPKWTRLVDSLNNLQGTLSVAKGGTGSATQNFVDLTTTQSVGGEKTFTSDIIAARFKPSATTASGTGIFTPTSTSLGFSTNGTNKMTLDASGNLGLGVTPYSTSALIKSFDFNTTGGFGSYSNSTNTQFTYLSSNAYINSGVNWAYKYSGVPASTFMQNTGEYQWFTAPSGTADNIISFTRVMTLTNSGNLGIGTASPAVQFHTTGGVRFAGLASITDLRTDADGDLFNGSDFNLKNSIDTINFGLSDVMKLKPVSFNWNDEARNINEYKSMGFIAQDVMNVIPNAASTMGDGDMQVDYNAIVATLTKAIQEQQALIKALEQRILILENK